MRNLFDQYVHPENRLTHALITSLAEDRRLLQSFVRWIAEAKAPRSALLQIIEQRLPGEPEISEEDATRRGLPDAVIYAGSQWALLIESKISAPVSADQLKRHIGTAMKRGFADAQVLLIALALPQTPLPKQVICRTWSDIYVWLMQRQASEWARRASGYFEVADSKLESGTLTKFWGVYFDRDEPYSFGLAKRILKQAMSELRRRQDLLDILHIDPAETGHAITGRDRSSVWDYLRFRDSNDIEPFTRFPHLALDIESNRLIAALAVANGIRGEFRRNLIGADFDEFRQLIAEVARNVDRAVKDIDGAAPWVGLVQRRYSHIKAEPIYDARVEYDPRTDLCPRVARWKVKHQPQWVKATYDALASKRSNLQFSIGAVFRYSDATRRKEILDAIAGTWLACRPVLNKLLGK